MNKLTYPDQVEKIITIFSALEKRARNSLFPNERTGIFVRPGTKNWNKLLKFLYRLSHPYSMERGTGLFDVIALPALFLLAWVTLVVAFGMVYVTTSSPGNSAETNISLEGIFITLCSVSGIFLFLISYFWWIEGMATKRYTLGAKLLVLTVFIISFLSINNSFSKAGRIQLSVNTLPIYVVLVIPSLTYFFAVGLDGIVETLYTIKTGFQAIRSLHNPLQVDNMRSLTLENIHFLENANQTFKLADLTLGELSTLQDWSQANRDATVHRLIPTSVVITILTLIGVSDTARLWTDNIIDETVGIITKFLTNPFSDAFLPGIGIFLILIPVIWFMKNLAKLFTNIAIQNLIIETCIVSRHARQVEIDSFKKQKTSTNSVSFFSCIARLFGIKN